MHIDKKGFTLVELLVTIVIIGLVIGVSTYGIIKAIDSSKNKANIVNEESLFKAARIYSGEVSSDSWKNADDYEAFCVTIGELMNKGLIEKNDEVDKNQFILVKRNKTTLAIEKEEMANTVGSESYEICTGESLVRGETIVSRPTISGSTSYTDKLSVNFISGSAIYKDGSNEESSVVSYSCLYGLSSSSINRVGRIEGNRCILEGLDENRDYYVSVYMDTNHGSTVLADGNNLFRTSDFRDTNMFTTDKTIKLTFYDTDNNGNVISSPSHYFKSSLGGITDVSVQSCTVNSDVFTCGGASTTNIQNGVWYKVSGSVVNITYSTESGGIDVTTRIYDGSNNYKQNSNHYTLTTVTSRFYKGNAVSIDGSTSEYIDKTCSSLTSGTSSGGCSITSPVIVKNGWEIVGWDTSESATTSSWGSGTSKSVSVGANYYPITKKTVSITFEKNGATSVGSTSESCTMHNSATSCTITSPAITRSGFTIVGWGTSSDATTNSWSVNTSKNVSDSATYYAVTGMDITISFNGNGGSAGSSSKKCTIYNSSSSCSISMPNASRSGYTFQGWSTSSSGSVSYYYGNSYNFSSDDTLYAKWQSASFGNAYGYDKYESIYTMYVWRYGSECKTRNQSAYDCDGTRCAGCSENYCETVGTITSGAEFYYVDINWDLTTTEYVSLIVYIKESEFNWKGPGLTGTSSAFGSCETDYINYNGTKYHRGIIPARCNASGCSTYQCHTTAPIDGYCKVCPNGVAIPENWSC